VDVNIGQYLTAGDDVNLFGHSLQIIQYQSDAVGGVDDGALGCVQLSCCTAHLFLQTQSQTVKLLIEGNLLFQFRRKDTSYSSISE